MGRSAGFSMRGKLWADPRKALLPLIRKDAKKLGVAKRIVWANGWCSVALGFVARHRLEVHAVWGRSKVLML